MASINIGGMKALIAGLEKAVGDLPQHRSRLAGIMDAVFVDPSPSNGLNKSLTWAQGELPGLRRRLALAESIEARTPGLQSEVQIDESTLPADPPDVSYRRGVDAANALKNSDGNPSDELLNGIQAGMNDPYFAKGFAMTASPEDLSKVALDMQRYWDTPNAHPGLTWQEYAARYKKMLSVVGTTIGTATRNTGDAALPADYADTWVHAITAQPHPNGDSGGAAAALYLRYGQWSTPFLDKVVPAVYDYERSFDGKPVWAPRRGANFHLMDPEGREAYDPLASLMFALGNNPQASQDFFTGGGNTTVDVNGHKVSVNSRLQYLLQERRTPTDAGDGLGNALEAASTYWRGNGSDPHDALSATVAGQTVALLGTKIGSGDGPLDDGFQVPSGMTDSIGLIIASYTPDLYRAAQGGDGQVGTHGWTFAPGSYPEGWPPDLPIGAVFNQGDLAKVLQSIGRSDDKVGISAVTTAGLQFQVDLEDSALKLIRSKDPNAPLTLEALRNSPYVNILKQAGIESGTALNFVVTNGFQGGDAEQKLDAADRERLAQIFDAATSFVPGPQGKIAGFLYGQAKSYVSGELGNAPDDKATKWANDANGSITQSLEYQTYNVLLKNGYLDPSVDKRSGLPADAVDPKTGQIKPWLYEPGGDKSPEYDQQTWTDFQNWYTSLDGAPRDQVEPWFLAPYKTKFTPNYG